MSTTAKGAPYPQPGDPNDVAGDLAALAAWIDQRAGISTYTTAQRDVLVGVDIWAGRVIFNVTTQRLEINKTGAAGAANWAAVTPIDLAANQASMRTLGTSESQAAAGNHGHPDLVSINTMTAAINAAKPTTESLALNAASGWNILASAHRRAGIVTFSWNAVATVDQPAGAVITTVPAGWRPTVRLWTWAADGATGATVSNYLDVDGTFRHTGSRTSGQQTVGYCTFVAS